MAVVGYNEEARFCPDQGKVLSGIKCDFVRSMVVHGLVIFLTNLDLSIFLKKPFQLLDKTQ